MGSSARNTTPIDLLVHSCTSQTVSVGLHSPKVSRFSLRFRACSKGPLGKRKEARRGCRTNGSAQAGKQWHYGSIGTGKRCCSWELGQCLVHLCSSKLGLIIRRPTDRRQPLPTLGTLLPPRMPFFQGASKVNASHGTFNDVTGDQTFTDNSDHSAATNSNNTTTVDKSSKVTDSSVHHSMGKILFIQRCDEHFADVVD